MKTKPYKITLAIAAVALACNGSSVKADTIKSIVNGGKATLNARIRYEYVDAPGAAFVNGYSIRTRLGLETGEANGWKAMVQVEDVSFADENNRPQLDVPTTEINQLWLSYKADGFSAKIGNQIFVLDDHRFIGHVGWRQNIQTFDAASIVFAPSSDTKITAAYLSRVNRVNATSKDLDGIVLNGSYKISKDFMLSGFAYLLDFDSWAAQSTNTIGMRGVGEFGEDDHIFNYTFSYANQKDAGGNTALVDLNYIEASIATSVGGVKLKAGYESLEGDGSRGFTTPLATVHKFAGFADVFAGASIGLGGGLPEGFDDLYVSTGYVIPVGNGLPITISYHQFETERGGVDLGDEFDMVAKYKVNERTTLISKYGNYDATEGESKTVFTMEANVSF